MLFSFKISAVIIVSLSLFQNDGEDEEEMNNGFKKSVNNTPDYTKPLYPPRFTKNRPAVPKVCAYYLNWPFFPLAHSLNPIYFHITKLTSISLLHQQNLTHFFSLFTQLDIQSFSPCTLLDIHFFPHHHIHFISSFIQLDIHFFPHHTFSHPLFFSPPFAQPDVHFLSSIIQTESMLKDRHFSPSYNLTSISFLIAQSDS